MNFKDLWSKLRSNPAFVTAYSLLGGAIGKELYTALQSGSFDWSLKSIQAMIVAAGATTVISLLHLYLPQPNAITIPVAAPATVNPPQPLETTTTTSTSVEPTGAPAVAAAAFPTTSPATKK
jgi:hypothetical protein